MPDIASNIARDLAHARHAAAVAREVAALGRHVSTDLVRVDPASLPPGEMDAMRADFERAMAAAPLAFLDRARAL